MSTRKTRAKRVKVSEDNYVASIDGTSVSSHTIDPEDQEEARKSRIRDSNKEFAKRMTILETWSDYWSDYSIREGEAYPKLEARDILKNSKKIACPITLCGKTFTTLGGLKYHYARCNIQRSFKCKVCNPVLELGTRGELLRHMILNHYDDLPTLEEEQKEIANSYLSCESRCDKSRREKRSTGDTETPFSSQSLLKAYKLLLDEAILNETFVDRPYKDWQSLSTHWEPVILETDRRKFYPPELESVHFKEESDIDWTTIKTGDYKILKKDKRGSPVSALFYTGGVNTASAWLPKSSFDKQSSVSPEIIAVSVTCCSMDKSNTYKESIDGESCIQFWTISNLYSEENGKERVNGTNELKITLSFMIGHSYGNVFDMAWCPLGASWQPQVNTGNVLSRMGLLALACADGQIRILSVPHTQSLMANVTGRIVSNSVVSTVPIFKAKPIATLMAPGVGPSTDYATSACKSISWNLEDNQRLVAAGYANGTVALFDLANKSPILYTVVEDRHIYQPLKSWVAHGAPVTGVAISSKSLNKTFISTGSIDRHLKIWNVMDLNSCIITDRAPITKVCWDFRYRGVVTATDTAFTSFNNRVTYRYPGADTNHNLTISTHRSTVWGLASSTITGAIATSDLAGEVFVMPQLINKSSHKRDKNILSVHSIYTMLPNALGAKEKESVIVLEGSNPEFCMATEQNVTVKSDAEEEQQEAEPDFSAVERPIANKPDKFLLPTEHPAVETYSDFKMNFGLQFMHYNTTDLKADSKLPESCVRAGDIKNIYCDRPCDYPFSSVNLVSWSPNIESLSYLLSATQVGFCRIDKIQIVEQIYRGHVNSLQHHSHTSAIINDKQ